MESYHFLYIIILHKHFSTLSTAICDKKRLSIDNNVAENFVKWENIQKFIWKNNNKSDFDLIYE